MAPPHRWVSQSQLQSNIHIANSCQQSLENLSSPFFNFSFERCTVCPSICSFSTSTSSSLIHNQAMASSNSECCAARSVHLRFQPDDECVDLLFYNEVTVERTTSGSYFMVCGWSCGYFGIQQLTDDMKHNNKIALFSVWDPITGDDPHRVNPSNRVVVENVGCGVQVDRFGGEGTGAKLMAPLPWKLDETVACFVQAHREGHLSCYTGWIKRPGTDDWWRLGTLKTRAGGILLKHLYSFIEDFRRDVYSAHQNRQALFGNGWVRVGEKHPTRWRPLSTAHFTASDAEWEAKETIDAGTCTKGFYLSTGGDVCFSIDIGCRIDCSHIHCTPPTLPLP